MPLYLGSTFNDNKNFGKKNCLCNSSISNNKKIYFTSGNVSVPDRTKTERNINSIRYSLGGITRFGNQPIVNQGIVIKKNEFNNSYVYADCYSSSSNLVTFLGKTEGQPGGITGPLRNKF